MSGQERTDASIVRLLWPWIRPNARVLGIAQLIGLLGAAAGLASPLATKSVVDGWSDRPSLNGPVGVLLGLLATSLVLSVAQQMVLAWVGTHTVERARTLVADSLVRVKMSELTGRPRGELVSRITADPPLLREATSTGVVGILTSVCTVVGSVVLMARLDAVLLLVALLAITAIAVLIALIQRPAARSFEQTQVAVARIGATLDGIIGALRTVKTSNAQDRNAALMRDHAKAATKHSFRATLAESAGAAVASAGIQLAILAVLGVGALRVGAGDLTTATLVAFLLYLVLLVPPASDLARNIVGLQAGAAAARRINAILTLEPERRTGEIAPSSGVLRVANASLTYPGATGPALRELSLAFPERGHCAIVGPSGAGKTSVLSLLLGLVDPDDGAVLIGSRDLRELSLTSVRDQIGYVEQAAPLLAGTVRDNLSIRHPGATDDELWTALAAVGLADRLRMLPQGLDSPIAADLLSGGESQRIALARMMIRPPRISILDEATAQLDAVTELVAADVVHRAARHGLVITVAHRLSTVLDADRIFVMEHGRLLAAGRHLELMSTCALYVDLVQALRIGPDASAPDTTSLSIRVGSHR